MGIVLPDGLDFVTEEGSPGLTLKVQLQNNVDGFCALLQTTLSGKIKKQVSEGSLDNIFWEAPT